MSRRNNAFLSTRHLLLSCLNQIGQVLQGSLILTLQGKVLIQPTSSRADDHHEFIIGVLERGNKLLIYILTQEDENIWGSVY